MQTPRVSHNPAVYIRDFYNPEYPALGPEYPDCPEFPVPGLETPAPPEIEQGVQR